MISHWKKSTYDQLGKDSHDSNDSLIYYSEDSEHSDSVEISPSPKKTKHYSSSNATAKRRSSNSEVVSKRQKQTKNMFVLDEAEDAFDTEDCFLTDDEGTEGPGILTQKFVVHDGDQDDVELLGDDDYSNYMKSVKHMVGQTNKYKLKYDYDANIDVYSQAVPQDDDYEYDSFCNDEIIYEGSTQATPDKKNLFASPDLRLRSKVIKKPRGTPISSTPVQNIKKRRYKRVIIESP